MSGVFSELIGRLVILRSRDAGVHIGRLVAAACEGGVPLAVLTDSQILWSWSVDGTNSQKSFTLHGISVHGVPSGSRLSPVQPDAEVVASWCTLLPLSEKAISSLKVYR